MFCHLSVLVAGCQVEPVIHDLGSWTVGHVTRHYQLSAVGETGKASLEDARKPMATSGISPPAVSWPLDLIQNVGVLEQETYTADGALALQVANLGSIPSIPHDPPSTARSDS